MHSIRRVAAVAAVLLLLAGVPPTLADASGTATLPTSITATHAGPAHDAGRTGEGVLVAVIGPSFDVTAAPLAGHVTASRSFDDQPLGAGTVRRGTASAEAILAVAPGAQLLLARATTHVQAEAALSWATGQGARLLVIDVPDPTQPLDGSGSLARAITAATAAGAIIVVPVGDAAEHHWTGVWRDDDRDGFLEFAPDDHGLRVNVRTGDLLRATLTWDEPSTTYEDYDLFLYDAATKVPLTWSTTYQAGGQPALETLEYRVPADGSVNLVVRNYHARGDATFHLFVDPNGPRFAEYAVPAGSLLSPADAVGAISVGATDATTGAPVPTSGLGPTDDGRAAPTVLAPSGVASVTAGPDGFSGASAAAAHIAGAVAVLLEERPTLTAPDAAALLATGPLDVGAAVARADVTPPRLQDVTLSPNGPLGVGDVQVTLTFDDVLAADPGGVIVLGPLRVEYVSSNANTWVGVAHVTADAAQGPAHLMDQGVRDWAGNAAPFDERPTAIVIDTVPPTLTLTNPPAHVAGPFDIGWIATDGGSGVSRVLIETSPDGVAWTPWVDTPDARGAATFTTPIDGATHRFRGTAFDAAGNAGHPVDNIISARADLTAPLGRALTPAAGSSTLDTRPRLEALVTDAGSGISPETVTLHLDADRLRSSYDAPTGRVAGTPAEPLEPGLHEVLVTARDRAGNPVSVAWSFEVTVPVAPPPAAQPTPPASQPPTPTPQPPAGPSGTASPPGANDPPLGPVLQPSPTPATTPTPSASPGAPLVGPPVTPLTWANPTGAGSPSATPASTPRSSSGATLGFDFASPLPPASENDLPPRRSPDPPAGHGPSASGRANEEADDNTDLTADRPTPRHAPPTADARIAALEATSESTAVAAPTTPMIPAPVLAWLVPLLVILFCVIVTVLLITTHPTGRALVKRLARIERLRFIRARLEWRIARLRGPARQRLLRFVTFMQRRRWRLGLGKHIRWLTLRPERPSR